MARRESVAVAGYYPTPVRVLESLTRILVKGQTTYRVGIADPCAGEGIALSTLAQGVKADAVFACEMEERRCSVLSKKLKNFHPLRVEHGDFMFLNGTPGCCNCLFLNPPYDTDSKYKRLEERFLQKAKALLTLEGTLVFVIPGYALAASAVTLARGFGNIHCFKFPEPEYKDYKQIVIFAQKVQDLPYIPTDVVAALESVARNPEQLQVLPEEGFQYVIRGNIPYHSVDWYCTGYDEAEIASYIPWNSQRGPLKGFYPAKDLVASFQRTYPVASPPRAAHLAAALSAGIFNGTRVEPTNPTSGFPSILVKGTFTKEFRKVEERFNDVGDKISETQVQAPKLSLTALDLKNGTFYSLKPSGLMTQPESLADATMGDLLDIYGKSLMQSMIQACPVLHDAKRGDYEYEIAGLARPLYAAQQSAVHTALKLYAQGNNVLLLGEIGSGKSSCALATAQALGKRKVLIQCPPHLLDGWRDQIKAVVPHYHTMILDNIENVRDFAAYPDPVIGILSRERAKLGHGWKSIQDQCPKCHGHLKKDADFVAKREHCSHTIMTPKNGIAAWLVQNRYKILSVSPNASAVTWINHPTPFAKKAAERIQKKKPLEVSTLREAMRQLVLLPNCPYEVVLRVLWLFPDLAPEVLALPYSDFERKQLLLCVPPDAINNHPRWESSEYVSASWVLWERTYNYVHHNGAKEWTFQHFGYKTFMNAASGSKEALSNVLSAVVNYSSFRSHPCNEPLFQAVPEPRRYPLASWICHRYRDTYDFLVLDEAHELGAEGSAQAHAAERLLQGKALVMELTGSVMNGYASSVFNSMRAVSPAFRKEFSRDSRNAFVDRYGYWKRIVQEKDQKGQLVAFGSCSDRVLSIKRAGEAPGIMPLFHLEHLLPVAITMQKEDLRINIPPTSDSVVPIDMQFDQAANYNRMLQDLLDEIKASRHVPGLSGKLWGALAHLPSYLDRACSAEGYEIRYPENTPEVGNKLITRSDPLPESWLLPKEQWMVDTVLSELEEGRNVMVFGWHKDTLPRYVKILQKQGIDVIYLEAEKVPTAKRQDWINKKVIKPGYRVLVVNPVTVQTGLNNLVYFHSSIWMENPACNPAIYRQAQGRTDRIGQTLPTRFFFPYYDDSAQMQLHKLLKHKVGVSRGVDGLDPEDALRAAGVLDEEYSGFSIGREIYRMLMGE